MRSPTAAALGGGPRQPAAPSSALDATLASLALWALTELPAAAAPDAMPGAPPAQSYYVSLGLFVMTVPGAWRLASTVVAVAGSKRSWRSARLQRRAACLTHVSTRAQACGR